VLHTIKKLIRNKKVLILGFGREGKSTYKILTQLRGYAKLDIADKLPLDIVVDDEHTVSVGDTYMDCLDKYDIVFKSPGVILPAGHNCRFTSQTDIFLRCYGRQVIGVTGTKGKSTVSSLIYHILSANRVDCALAGNIGVPVFDIVDRIAPKTVVILELSCHQLECCAHAPSVAVLLNIFEDHLDRYKSFEAYAETKSNIYKYQYALDTLFCNPENMPSKEVCASRIVPVTRSGNQYRSALYGEHNALNCDFAYNVCGLLNISDDAFSAALQTFRSLPHRLEFIGKKDGVDYYDDSISTAAESTIGAVKSIRNAKLLLLGGTDRGIDYSALVNFLPRSGLTHIILMYESGKRIYRMLEALSTTSELPEFIYAPDLCQAIDSVKKYAQPGDACILSPAAASYGNFKDFEERGDVFRRLVFESRSKQCAE
jgi:UDP-N-acetylmuramoylalanine--D-glutamate ligase